MTVWFCYTDFWLHVSLTQSFAILSEICNWSSDFQSFVWFSRKKLCWSLYVFFAEDISKTNKIKILWILQLNYWLSLYCLWVFHLEKLQMGFSGSSLGVCCEHRALEVTPFLLSVPISGDLCRMVLQWRGLLSRGWNSFFLHISEEHQWFEEGKSTVWITVSPHISL